MEQPNSYIIILKQTEGSTDMKQSKGKLSSIKQTEGKTININQRVFTEEEIKKSPEKLESIQRRRYINI